MTAENFLKEIFHFAKFSICSKIDPVLLLFDNHESHINIETIQFAKDNVIIMVTFPPTIVTNSSH